MITIIIVMKKVRRDQRFSKHGHNLRIERVGPKDNGEYTCEVAFNLILLLLIMFNLIFILIFILKLIIKIITILIHKAIWNVEHFLHFSFCSLEYGEGGLKT